MENPNGESRVRRAARELKELLIIGLLIFTGRSVLADWYQVPTGSMKPTILEGDRVFVAKCAYQIRFPFSAVRLFSVAAPKRGNVVVVRNPDGGSTPLVKRVVGLPGNVVELKGERLFVNGIFQPLKLHPAVIEPDEPAWVGTEKLGGRVHPVQILPDRPAMRSFGPVRVPTGEIFLMGDNRDDSRDGRYFGPRPISDLLGKAEGIFWSWNPAFWKGPRLSRFACPLATAPKS